MFSTVLGFPEGRVIAPFLRQRPQVFPRVKVIMNLKRLVVLLYSKLSVIRLYLFFFYFFWLAFCFRGKMTNTISSSLRSFNIYRKWNGRREFKVLYEEEGTVYSTCVFLWILWNFQEDLFSEHVRATVSEYSRIEFYLKIDGNSDTVHLIEGFVF